MGTAKRVFALFLIASAARGALYETPADLPTLEYDYVIVGAGTAGLVVANRLSEDTNTTVLVLEAGESNEGVLASEIPVLYPKLWSSPYDWNYTTIPQSGLGGKTIPYARGHMLGGSSSINVMIHTRGPKDDFDRYAKIIQNKDLSWDSVYQKWMPKIERFRAPTDTNVTGRYIPAVHSATGRVSVTLPSYPVPLDDRVIALTREFPNEYPFLPDMNSGTSLGIGWTQAMVGDGQRSSSAIAYLTPEDLARPNLAVLIHARATKIVQNGTDNHLPKFDGVEFARNATGPITRVRARREVIVSSGAFNSPQLLMLSGIGDPSLIEPLGIKTIVNLPSVGKNATDHTLLSVKHHVNSNDTLEMHLLPSVINSSMADWKATRKGPLAFTINNQVGWFRLGSDDSFIAKYGDSASGPLAPHYEFMFVNGVPAAYDGSGPTNSFTIIMSSPTSRGSLTINSSNPFNAPVIDPNFLSTDYDMHIMVESLKTAQKIAKSESYKGYFVDFYSPISINSTEAELAQYARANTSTCWHFSGTAAMTSVNARYGVVDPDFRVKNTAGLRVVDASVFPFIPSGHITAPVYIFAEIASEYIKNQNKH